MPRFVIQIPPQAQPTIWERAVDPIAIYTLVLAVATIGLWIITWRMMRATKKSVDLARDEFNATHRPCLRVRNIAIKPAAQGPGQIPLDPLHPGYVIHGQFYVSNVGDAEATVVESYCEVAWGMSGLPMQRPYEGKDGNNPVPSRSIASGSNLTALFFSDEPFPGVGFSGDGRTGLYVMGWVEYVDSRDIRRRTAFCREYCQRNGSRRFFPVEDPDYEYEE